MRIGGRQLWSQGKARLLLLELTSRSGDFLWTVDDGRLKVIENISKIADRFYLCFGIPNKSRTYLLVVLDHRMAGDEL